MDSKEQDIVQRAKRGALDVLMHNARSGRAGLPRTAAWGYPEPYTRDLMISSLGVLVTGDEALLDSLRQTLTSIAANQSALGLVPGLADDPEDLGSSDTTPLFLIALAAYRTAVGEPAFLDGAASKAIRWMEYQSPADRVIVAQQPTSDWRDEQWVLGFGLWVNALAHSYLRLFGHTGRADTLKARLNNRVFGGDVESHDEPTGLALHGKPHYAVWSYKLYCSERLDLLGNSLAILSGVATRTKALSIVTWIEDSCRRMRQEGTLALDLPPSLFPFIRPEDPNWRDRYAKFNNPGEYHNGGVWPFVCGFYVAALVAVGRQRLAENALVALAELNGISKSPELTYGFNEWIRAQDGLPRGNDWQHWSTAMYLYAAECVRSGSTPVFEQVRGSDW